MVIWTNGRVCLSFGFEECAFPRVGKYVRAADDERTPLSSDNRLREKELGRFQSDQNRLMTDTLHHI